MIVLDTDIVTLLSYGTKEKLNKRYDEIADGEEVAITVITFMEILEGRFASIETAANEDEFSRQWSGSLNRGKCLGVFRYWMLTKMRRSTFKK